jgi:hypothetical protein
MVYFCYIDESGTPEVPGNTSHYVLAGLSIPISYWKLCEKGISKIKQKYDLQNSEVHTGWIIRKYLEQSKIIDFDTMNYIQRRYEVNKIRNAELLKLQKSTNKNHYKQTRKNYRQTYSHVYIFIKLLYIFWIETSIIELLSTPCGTRRVYTSPFVLFPAMLVSYVHLTYSERISFIQEIADLVGSWSFARLFAECINKIHFDPVRAKQSVDEQTLEQLVSRFEQYMKIVSKSTKDNQLYGTLIHDNNETVSKKHTALMKKFHSYGTLWTSIEHIIETPFFVNSELTSLVQIADLCSYALRRYFENNETDLLDRIQSRFDRKNGKIVGLRHFTDSSCKCIFCV